MLRNQPLQKQFRVWTLLLIAVPAFLIMGIYTVGQINIAKRQNLELLNQRVHFQQQVIVYWMEERGRTVHELAQTDAIRVLDRPLMIRLLSFVQKQDSNFDSLSYIDKEGMFSFSTLPGGIRHPSAKGQPYYEAALAGKEFVSDVVVGRNSGQPILNFSSPIYDLSGEFQGLILGSVRMTTLETLVKENWIGRTGEMFIVDRQGMMLTQSRFDQDRVLKPDKVQYKIPDDAFGVIRFGESGTGAWTDHASTKVLGAYIDVPNNRWTIIGKINEDEVLAPIYSQLAVMAFGTAILVLFLLPLATTVTNRIKQPIDWLIEQSKLVAAENYKMIGRDSRLVKMPQELNSLCDAFVKMSNTIEKNMCLLKANEIMLESKLAEIRVMNQVLECEIAERQTAVAALRRANEELTDANQKVRDILESISDGFFALDNQWRLVYINPVARKISFADIDEPMGRNLWDLVGEHSYFSHLTEAKEKNTAVHFETMTDETARRLEVNAYPSREGISVYFRDITEQKEASQKLIDATRLVDQGQRLASLGIMATSIAHEINQPLNSIKVSSSGVLYALNNGIKRSKADMLKEFESISEQVDRVDAVIKNIRSFVKNDYSDRQSVDVGNVVEQVIKTLANQPIFWDISLTTHIAKDLPNIMANELHLQQVINNLMMNAAQSLAANSRKSKVIEIAAWQENEHVIIEVNDNGLGLRQELIHKIFEPFFSGRSNPQAMGLGLAIVQTIINGYGGTVSAFNNNFGGATFRIEFPNSDRTIDKL